MKMPVFFVCNLALFGKLNYGVRSKFHVACEFRTISDSIAAVTYTSPCLIGLWKGPGKIVLSSPPPPPTT